MRDEVRQKVTGASVSRHFFVSDNFRICRKHVADENNQENNKTIKQLRRVCVLKKCAFVCVGLCVCICVCLSCIESVF